MYVILTVTVFYIIRNYNRDKIAESYENDYYYDILSMI